MLSGGPVSVTSGGRRASWKNATALRSSGASFTKLPARTWHEGMWVGNTRVSVAARACYEHKQTGHEPSRTEVTHCLGQPLQRPKL